MSIFKCKMCGGDLEVNEQMSVCECQYCGSRQTLPKLGSEKKNNLYDRAGHFRRNNEYDKAMSIYEQILSEEPEDAESYWSLVLCRYGIEYVEDPMTHKRVPTVNRAQFTSIFSDEDYKSALKYADAEQRAVYEAEAREIEQIQKGILAISNQEEAFDVFICYKESDANGRRTPDSVLANDLYHQLTQEGFRVFFARITLEDKLGSAYEPYIFAALNSAKVMVVLGTKPEYFNAVWVKNEWSRYLALIRGGAKKILIPAYKDMDPYDLPEEFSHLQAQDMSKLGFMQDLIRGIKKMAGGKDGKEEQNSTRTVADSGAEPLLKRAFMFLEDGEFEKADEFCEQALNLDPENARAYVGKLMSELRVRKQEELGNCEEKLTENNYFQKAIRFAKDSLKKELERCNQLILDREKDNIYEEAGALLGKQGEKQFEETVEALDMAIKAYKEVGSWKDSELKLTEAVAKREELYEKVYIDAKNAMELGLKKGGKTKGKLASIREAESLLQKIEGYRDSKELEERCNTEYKNIKRKGRKKVRRRTIAWIGSITLIAFSVWAVIFVNRENKYKAALKYAENADYEEAIGLLEELEGYRDSSLKISEYSYRMGVSYFSREMYKEALNCFKQINGSYQDKYDYIEKCEYEIQSKEKYDLAMQYKEQEEYEKARNAFQRISEYKDSAEQADECQKKINALTYQKAISHKVVEEYDEAIAVFKKVLTYKDSKTQIEKCEELKQNKKIFEEAMNYKETGRYDKAVISFGKIKGYKTAYAQMKECVKLKKRNIVAGGWTYVMIVERSGMILTSTDSDSEAQLAANSWWRWNIVEIAGGASAKYGLTETGEVLVVGDDGFNSQVENWTDIVQIVVNSNEQVFGLKCDGTVVAVGKNEDGECNVGKWTDIMKIAFGEFGDRYHTVGLKLDGTVVATGDNYFGQCNVSDWMGIMDIVCGDGYTIGRKSSGMVVATGNNDEGQCNVSSWRNIVDVAGGKGFTVGLKADGTVVATGRNSDGQCDVNDWKNIVAIACGDHYTIGLRSDGTVVGTGNNVKNQSDLNGWTDIEEIATDGFWVFSKGKDGYNVMVYRYSE